MDVTLHAICEIVDDVARLKESDGKAHISLRDLRQILEQHLIVVNPTEKAAAQAGMILNQLRQAGWTIAVHNDYRLQGEAYTFYCLTHPSGWHVVGEGKTDADALRICRARIDNLPAEPPSLPERK